MPPGDGIRLGWAIRMKNTGTELNTSIPLSLCIHSHQKIQTSCQGWARDVKAQDRDETLTCRDRDVGFTSRDETETLVHLETVSRPRRRDRDHNPAYCYYCCQPQILTTYTHIVSITTVQVSQCCPSEGSLLGCQNWFFTVWLQYNTISPTSLLVDRCGDL